MDNFLVKSKDLFAEKPGDYPHFKEVFDTIRRLSVAKNYFDCNLHNIEEILSILEMLEAVGDGKNRETFVRYVTDVVRHYTPNLQHLDLRSPPGNWNEHIVPHSCPFRPYFQFVLSLMSLKLSKRVIEQGGVRCVRFNTERELGLNSYGVVTLNYDRVLEVFDDLLVTITDGQHKRLFRTKFDHASQTESVTPLAKLHGSVEDRSIIAPTWNKTVTSELQASWSMAYTLLSQANYIRIIGYSLPTSDAYIKYLLKAAVIENEHLKEIDVLCLDPDGEIRKRYDAFIPFRYYRFFDVDVLRYLENMKISGEALKIQSETATAIFDRAEDGHRNFVRECSH